LIVSVSVIFS